MATQYYFAYGSNMNPKRMMRRTGIRRGQVGVLRGWWMRFNKLAGDGITTYANIEPKPRYAAVGVLYKCNKHTLWLLDQHEGVGVGHYKRRKVQVQVKGGKFVNAIAYVACKRVTGEGAPTADYLGHIIYGAKAHGIPVDAVVSYKAKPAKITVSKVLG